MSLVWTFFDGTWTAVSIKKHPLEYAIRVEEDGTFDANWSHRDLLKTSPGRFTTVALAKAFCQDTEDSMPTRLQEGSNAEDAI